MKKVYCQPYKKGLHISCWYGKPPKDVFKDDVIRLNISQNNPCKECGNFIYLTIDEAVAYIRALSSGIHHAYLETVDGKRVVKNKNK